jgi:opacity protein-like surface antigen
MKFARDLGVRCVVAVCLGAVAGVAAANPLGPYVGLGIGQADIRSDAAAFGSSLRFDEHNSAWKVMAGIRPISLVGVEVEYINFGHPHGTTSDGTAVDVNQKAVAAFGVLGLPLPIPFLDIYGKAGLASLSSTVNASQGASCIAIVGQVCPTYTFHGSRTNTEFAYGVGVQVKVASLGVRAEYERIAASGGNPDLPSVGLTWSF